MQRVVHGFCPICRTLLPIITVTVTTTGLFRKHVDVEVEGDATDYVAHLWSHQQRLTDPA